jgi:hypothetical protein
MTPSPYGILILFSTTQIKFIKMSPIVNGNESEIKRKTICKSEIEKQNLNPYLNLKNT